VRGRFANRSRLIRTLVAHRAALRLGTGGRSDAGSGGRVGEGAQMGDASLSVEFKVLGPLEVVRNGRLVSLGGARQGRVLAVVVASANAVVSADRLIDVVWGDEPPDSALSTLQKYVYRLRGAVDPGTGAADSGGRLLTRAPGYLLRIETD